MQERTPSFEHQEKRILPKSCSMQILFLILLLIIPAFYLIQNKSLPLRSYVIISQNHYSLSKTKIMLSEQNLFSGSNTIRCVVYVKNRNGRLGNRMFIIASAYGLARLYSCHLYLTEEILNEIQQIFLFNFSSLLISSTTFDLMVSQSNSTTRISKDIQCKYVLELTRPNAISKGQLFELLGYWQSYLHFIKYANDLRQNIFIGTSSRLEKISHFFLDIYQQKFHLKPQFLFHHHIFKQQLTNLNQTVWIGIHVRRTDFVDLHFSSSDEYLFTAIKYFTERYSNAHFIVASDDKSYCRNLFKNRPNIFITPDSFSVGDDLIILSLCEHSIVTTGTFGWWAAFLANGEVIHDRVYPSGCEKREHYYPPWFLINGYVRAHKNSDFIL